MHAIHCMNVTASVCVPGVCAHVSDAESLYCMLASLVQQFWMAVKRGLEPQSARLQAPAAMHDASSVYLLTDTGCVVSTM